MLILEERGGRLVVEWETDMPTDKLRVFDEAQTYSGDSTPLTAARTTNGFIRCRKYSMR